MPLWKSALLVGVPMVLIFNLCFVVFHYSSFFGLPRSLGRKFRPPAEFTPPNARPVLVPHVSKKTTTFPLTGEIRLMSKSNQCLDTLQHRRVGESIGSFSCHGGGGTQGWSFASATSSKLFNPSLNLCVASETWTLVDCDDKTSTSLYYSLSESFEVVSKTMDGSPLKFIPRSSATSPKTDQEGLKQSMSKYDFNEDVSRAIGIRRDVPNPDIRHGDCKSRAKMIDVRALQPTSIIICFVDEEWWTLLRTVHSVLEHTPDALVQEIILVDDGSTAPHLDALPDYVAANFPKTKLVHTGSRSGLIRARLLGVSHATAPTITFLDSHIEVNPGWLSPLLEIVTRDRTTIACPIIVVISQKDLKFQSHLDVHNVAYGVFDWKLIFHWNYLKKDGPPSTMTSRSSPADPVPSPTMAGGLFTMNRDFFYEIGSYDEGMDGWGGENIEMSFRTWMCGGRIEIVPCSIVGHIFRKKNPTKFPGTSVTKVFRHNLKRVAEVWMDDHKSLFYSANKKASMADGGDVSDRVALRERLQCRSFDWYLRTLMPNMFAPFPSNVINEGVVRFVSIDKCLDIKDKKAKSGARLFATSCGNAGSGSVTQKWYFTKDGQIRGVQWPIFKLCVDAANLHQGKIVTARTCDTSRASSQVWAIEDDNENKRIRLAREQSKCLTSSMTLEPCDSDNAFVRFGGAAHVARKRSKVHKRAYRSLGQDVLDCDENADGAEIVWPEYMPAGSQFKQTSADMCGNVCDEVEGCNAFTLGSGGDCWLKAKCGEPVRRSPADCPSKPGYTSYFLTEECSKGRDNNLSEEPYVDPYPEMQRLHGPIARDSKTGIPYNRPIRTPSKRTRSASRSKHGFDERLSASIPLDRPVRSKRLSSCDSLSYSDDLPDTSVIFVFVNEAESVLFRSIHSVLNRTPPRLLKEIILVDDGSDLPHLGQPLDDYVTNRLPDKVKLIRLGGRNGLVKARLAGARAAKGQTVTILDSHIEVQRGWLEPLMSRIAVDRQNVVMPIIDGMDGNTFEPSNGKIEVLGFLWTMVEHGIPLQQVHRDQRSSETDPEPSPAMAGGLFSIDRSYFFELGGYDEEFGFWGAENLEFSFRIWQCGGRIEVLPCSRVYHVFRHGGKPYKINSGDVVKNKLRTAAIWMDDYATYAYDLLKKSPETVDIGPLDKMRELRERLQCKSFAWYLKNVYPENSIDILKDAPLRGALSNPHTGMCLDNMGHLGLRGHPGFFACHGKGGTQSFVFTKNNRIRVEESFDRCVQTASEHGSVVELWDCGGGKQGWHFDERTGELRHTKSGLCMDAERGGSNGDILSECVHGKASQRWVWEKNAV